MPDYTLRKYPKKVTDGKVVLKDEDLRRRTRWAINYVADAHDLKNETMAPAVGATVGTLSNYRAMNTSPKVEFIKNFCEKYNFDEVWFLKGQGEPFPGARIKYPEVCGPEESNMVRETKAGYGMSGQKININEAWGKVHRILSAGTPLSIALYLNIQQFAAALDTGRELKTCQEQISGLQAQINELRGQVDRLTAHPAIAADLPAGSDKKAM